MEKENIKEIVLQTKLGLKINRGRHSNLVMPDKMREEIREIAKEMSPNVFDDDFSTGLPPLSFFDINKYPECKQILIGGVNRMNDVIIIRDENEPNVCFIVPRETLNMVDDEKEVWIEIIGAMKIRDKEKLKEYHILIDRDCPPEELN